LSLPNTHPQLLASKWSLNIDTRGSFQRLYSNDEIRSEIPDFDFKQANLSFSAKAFTLRGMHFQSPPHSEHKLITCISGRILDVCIDVRMNSKDFGSIYTFNLDASDPRILSVPKGFAHGFLTLEPESSVVYFVDENYNKEYEKSIHYKSIDFKWPYEINEISEKDLRAPRLLDLKIARSLC
jgi:dTDP-4-dehydrorhamnose 3,5-epimerase